MPEDKRPAKFDDYSSNQVKTLEDLFNLESSLNQKLAELKKKLDASHEAAVKTALKKQIADAKSGYSKLIADLDKKAAASIKKQTKNRLAGYEREAAEYKQFLKQQTTLSKKQIDKQVDDFKKAQKIQEDLLKKRKSREGKEELIRAKQQQRADRETILEESKHVLGGVGTIGEQMTASFAKVGENLGKSIGKAFADISNKINSAMDTYSKYQSSIDTRLQDSGKTFTAMQDSLKRAVGASPYLKTETMLNNLQVLVETGIVTNVEQRAFLNTIKDKVAATFDAANGSLLRIIRLQRNDSTAARLGMEAYLTSFLNRMVENTEYLNSTFDSVQEALLEASSIMNTDASTEFEYIVQKWLGALTGRGLSESTATGLAGALGMLGSGNVTGLSNNAFNNLLVMASARAGLDYGDLLVKGLDKSSVNALLLEIVKYMEEIDKNNNVVRSQYAQTFGLSVSDLAAASNLADSLSAIYADTMSYTGMFAELSSQLDKVSSRTHISEKIANLFENAQFSLASNIAGDATMAAIWKVTDMIQGVTGGINIPMISVLGNAVDLETTVENLMKIGIVGIGSLGMINDVVTGLSNSGSRFSNVLNQLGFSSATTNYRTNFTGSGLAARTGTATRARSGMSSSVTGSVVSNASGEDIQGQTLSAAMDEAKAEQAEAAKEQENPQADIKDYLVDSFDSRFDELVNTLKVQETSLTEIESNISPVNTLLTGIQSYLINNLDTRLAVLGSAMGINTYTIQGAQVGWSSAGISIDTSSVAGIQYYLVNVFDAKLNTMISMMSGNNSAQAGEDLPKLMLGKSAIQATYKVDDSATSNKESLNSIENNVSNIYNLLANGVITVRTESTATSIVGVESSGW